MSVLETDPVNRSTALDSDNEEHAKLFCVGTHARSTPAQCQSDGELGPSSLSLTTEIIDVLPIVTLELAEQGQELKEVEL